MRKDLTILTLLGVSLLWTGCANRKCVGAGAHDGLYNALTCDYSLNIKELQTKLDEKSLNRNRLFHEFQRLIAKVTNKTEKLERLREDVLKIENDLGSVNTLLATMNSDRYSVKTIDIIQLKQRLSSLNMNILNKSTFFDIADASFTNQKLLEKSDKQRYAKNNSSAISGEKYAKNNSSAIVGEKYAKNSSNSLSNERYAKNNSSAISDEKYAKAYNKDSLIGAKFAKAYQQDIDKDREMRLALSDKLKNLSDSINSSTMDSSKGALSSLMSDIERYKNSLKKS